MQCETLDSAMKVVLCEGEGWRILKRTRYVDSAEQLANNRHVTPGERATRDELIEYGPYKDEVVYIAKPLATVQFESSNQSARHDITADEDSRLFQADGLGFYGESEQ